MSSYGLSIASPAVLYENASSEQSPTTLLSGVELARTLDMMNYHHLFLHDNVFKHFEVESNGRCHRSYFRPYDDAYLSHQWIVHELNARVSPEIKVLYDDSHNQFTKDRVWNEIYDRIGFRVTNPYRFQRINPHQHFPLEEIVWEALDYGSFKSLLSQSKFNPWRPTPPPPGSFRRCSVAPGVIYRPGTDAATKSLINDYIKKLYEPTRGWLRLPIPGRADNCPWRRHKYSSVPRHSEDVFGPQPMSCAVCRIIFKANIFVSEVCGKIKLGV
ncbi:hypothetical protein F5Y11DRAFT_345163 [Daldinia sp. FL1419]|nr:hypothetical protein F5Y11DRAFT_345163 [Daldinia sp. FL1419]